MKKHQRGLNRGLALFLVATSASSPARAQEPVRGQSLIVTPAVGTSLSTHNLFQSNMVLQRDKPVRVWGYAQPDATVHVAFAGQSARARAGRDRHWAVTLPERLVASREPRTMTISSGTETLTYDNILVGDVWVLGGQSNMEHAISRCENGELEIASANFPEIRMMTVPYGNGVEPVTDFACLYEWSDWFSTHYRKGFWDVCTPETVRELSGLGYVFVRRLHMASQVPIGVIDVSRGGTTVETWTPDALMRNSASAPIAAMLEDWDRQVESWDAAADLAQRIQQHEQYIARMTKEGNEIPANRRDVPADLRPGPIANHNHPSACYNGMLQPLSGLAVKGVIFHQGYNNCFDGTEGARMYRDALPLMIEGWREAFGDPRMPFCILSLCTEGSEQTRGDYASHLYNAGPYIREAQYQTYLELVNAGDQDVGFVSTYDLQRRWYHPQLKIPAGERAARWALATEYDFNRLQWQPAVVEEMTVEDGRLLLRFDRDVAAVDNGMPMEGFGIAGADRRFHPATIAYRVTGQDDRNRDQHDRKTLVLSSPMVPAPVAYRYAWARMPWANILTYGGTSDVPIATQRSDDWPMEMVPLGVFENDELPPNFNRGHANRIRQALQQIDIQRRLLEARQLIEDHDGTR